MVGSVDPAVRLSEMMIGFLFGDRCLSLETWIMRKTLTRLVASRDALGSSQRLSRYGRQSPSFTHLSTAGAFAGRTVGGPAPLFRESANDRFIAPTARTASRPTLDLRSG